MIEYINHYLNKGLFQVIFHVTYKCNSRCKFCFNWKNLNKKEREELTMEEIDRISKSLPHFPWLMISGGEPFIRQDLHEIISIFYKNNKVKHVTISTNGLLKDTILRQIPLIVKHKNLSVNLVLSLDGIGKKHDQIRGVKGNFNEVISMYRHLTKLKKTHKNLAVKFNTVVAESNYKGLNQIISFVRKLKPDMHSVDFIRISPASPDSDSVRLPPKEAIPGLIKVLSRNIVYYGGFKNLRKHSIFLQNLSKSIMLQYFNLFNRIVNEKRQVISCLAPKLNLVIYPYGDVAFCELMDTFGNLRDYSYNYKNAIRSDKFKKLQKTVKNKGCYCYHPCYQYVNILFNPKELFKSLRFFAKK